MRRILLFLLGVIASITIVNAGKVTEQQALQKAQQFMKGKTLSKANAKSLSRGRSSDDAFYVFNAENDGGFVIVAGDDRVPAILGYSDTGKMDMGHLPENVQHWLEGYAAQVRSVSEGKSTARSRGTRAALAPIEPLIKTQWGQGEPFNRMCPYLGGDRCVTGCVATALAQILYYYRWPESVASLPAYTTYTKQINMPELPATTFNYDLMQTTYSWDESENIPSREEVAKLLRYCGQSLQMDYDLGGSGAGLSTEVLKEYYQYSWRAHTVFREEYPDDVWDAMMYEELQNGCPIPYDGFSNNGGHQFILDGYKDGLFHINWGWGGWCDGYFILALANSTQPEYTATEGEYSEGQGAILGVVPARYEKKAIVDGLQYVCDTKEMTAVVINGDYDEMTEVVIPASIQFEGKTYIVTEIANNAFGYCWAMQRLDLPSTLKVIGDCAFANCKNLSTVICRMENPLDINENVFTIYDWFSDEETGEQRRVERFSKATLYVPEGTSAKYQEAAVWKKFPQIYEGELKEITVDGLNYSYVTGPKFATVLAGDYSALETVVIPSSITVDGVDYQVKFIADNAFRYSNSLKSLTLSEGLEKIGNSAFYGCSGIEHLVIPEGVKVIGNNAFNGCYNVKRLDLPSSLTAIGENAFYGMSALTTVKVAALEPLTINENVFTNKNWVKNEETGEWDSFEVFSQATLYVPEGTSSKYQEAAVWKKFPQIYEGDLKETTVDGLNYSYVTGSKFATVLAGDYSALETVVIPSTITVDGVEYKVKAIEDKAFYDCYSMKSLTLSVGLEKIGFSAFRYCSGIKQLVIPEGVKTIGSYAFSSCSYLEQLYLPSSLTDMGEYAFYDMSSLSSVVAAALEPLTINENVFTNKNWVKNEETGEWDSFEVFSQATLYVPEGTSSKYQEAPVWKEFGDIIEKAMAEGSVVPPTAITGLVYSGTAQCLINAGSSDTGIIQYSIDDTDYSTDIPQVTDAKEYTVYYRVITQEGLINVYPASLKVTIAPKAISSPVITLSQTSYEYDGTAQEPTVTVKDGETTIPASNYTVSYQDNIEVGIATVIVTNTDDGNYIFSGSTTFEITAPDIPIPDEEVITISGALQVPYYSAYNLDFTDKPELRAYVATGYDKSTGVIWLTRVKQVPAETGFLLMGDPGDYDIPTIDGVSDVYYKNMFKGTLEGTTLYTTDGDYTNYYLSKGDQGVGFYKVTKAEGVKVGANRCYLPILTEIPAEGSTGDTEMIKVSAAKQVPYYTSKNLDFTTMEAQGVKAYTATGYNYSTGVIWLTRVKKVPAKTGILVMADKSGDYNVPTTTVQSVYENMFVGSETAQTIYTNEEIGGVDYVNYYLSSGTAGVGFYKVTNPDGVKMGANRCYLPIPKCDAASGARGKNGESSFCKMVLSDEANDDVIAIPLFADDATGIEFQSSIFNLQSNEVYYNLQGQPVETPRKGIYIKNGRKVVIK